MRSADYPVSAAEISSEILSAALSTGSGPEVCVLLRRCRVRKHLPEANSPHPAAAPKSETRGLFAGIETDVERESDRV